MSEASDQPEKPSHADGATDKDPSSRLEIGADAGDQGSVVDLENPASMEQQPKAGELGPASAVTSRSNPKKQRGLLGSSAIVGGATMSSRVLGLIRDMVLATIVGASSNADAFFVAFKIPNFLRRLFAEGAFAQAFVPVLTDTREHGGQAAVKHLVDRVAGSLASVLALLSVVTILAAPVVATIFAPGFHRDPAKLALTADLIRITFPYLLLISLTGFAGSILNSYGRFAVPAFTPILLNLSLISAAVWGVSWVDEPVFALAYGVLLAGVLQFLVQIPALWGIGMVPKPVWDWGHPGVKRVLGLMVPALFGVSVSQINLLLDTVLASLLPSGSVAWLYYSDRLTELPLGVFGIAIATVILPALSTLRARAEDKQFSAALHWAVRSIWLIAAPAMVALWLLAEPILATLFQYGAFSDTDRAMAAASLRAYTLGLGAFMLIKVLAPGFYSREDMKTPVRIGIIAMVANMILNPLMIFPLMWQYNLGHVGLAVATSLSAWLNATLLLRGLKRDGVWLSQPGSGVFAIRLSGAVLAMGAVLAVMLPDSAVWAMWAWPQRVMELGVLVAAGGSTYLATLFMAGIRLADLKPAKA